MKFSYSVDSNKFLCGSKQFKNLSEGTLCLFVTDGVRSMVLHFMHVFKWKFNITLIWFACFIYLYYKRNGFSTEKLLYYSSLKYNYGLFYPKSRCSMFTVWLSFYTLFNRNQIWTVSNELNALLLKLIIIHHVFTSYSVYYYFYVSWHRIASTICNTVIQYVCNVREWICFVYGVFSF